MKFIKKVGLVFCMLGIAVGGNAKSVVIHKLSDDDKTLLFDVNGKFIKQID